MSTKLRRNQVDGNKDAADPAISSDVFRSLVMAITQAMITAITNAMFTVPVTPKTITDSSDIYLYEEELFETKTKEGK